MSHCLCCAELTCQRAQISDNQRILELGCSWGSLSLYIAAKYPLSHVTAICNNMAQKLFVKKQCRQRGLANVQVNWLPCQSIYMHIVYLHILVAFHRFLALSGKKVHLSQSRLVTASIQADRLLCQCHSIVPCKSSIITAGNDC